MLVQRREEFIEDESPFYEKISSPSTLSKYSTNTDEPPAYTNVPIREDLLQQRSIWKRYKLWLFCLILAMMAIAGGITGGLLRGKRKAALDESSPIIALASTECEAGTFVFYQTNSSEIFMEGRFRDATFNGTVSPNITSTRIKIPSDDVLPIMGTNMTAVCGYSGISSAILHLYYFSQELLSYSLIEAVIEIPYQMTVTQLSITKNVLTQQSNPSTISAVYVPSSGIHLYYLAQTTTGQTSIFEMTKGPSVTLGNFSDPVMLNATAHHLLAPMTATAAEPYPDDPNGLLEINLFFLDSVSCLSRILFSRGSGWNNVQRLTMNHGDYINSTNEAIPMLAAIIPQVYKNVTGPLIFFIQQGRVNQISMSIPLLPAVRDNSSPNLTVSDPSTKYNFPLAVQAPGLITVTSWNTLWNKSMSIDALGNAGNNDGVERIQIFYAYVVGASPSWGQQYLQTDFLDIGLVNVTGKSRVFGGFE